MPLDPQAQNVIDQIAALNLAPIETLDAPAARRQYEARRGAVPPGPDLWQVENRAAAGPTGETRVRVYRPGPGVLPALVYFHGGGWVVGDLESHDATCRHLARASGCAVLAVDYRLAPEHRFPAAIDDAYAATAWVAENAAALQVDPARLAVGGDSAGGNLAAAVCLQARDRHGPRIAFQLLVYPVTDHDLGTPSYVANGEGYLLRKEAMRWYWDQYAPDPTDRDSPYASPLRAADLANLPAGHVITAEYDPLRHEGEAFARRLREAGVEVTHTRYPGMIHGFFGMSHVLDKGKEAIEEAGQALRKALGGQRSQLAPRGSSEEGKADRGS